MSFSSRRYELQVACGPIFGMIFTFSLNPNLSADHPKYQATTTYWSNLLA